MATHRKAYVALLLGAVFLLGGCGSDSKSSKNETPPPVDKPEVTLVVVSSAPDQVSGGDVRIAISGHDDADELELWLNDKPIGLAGLRSLEDRLEGLVDGLDLGENRLEVHHAKHGRLAGVTLTNYPISGPMFSGPQQYPFVCSTVAELGKQPLVDSVDLPETGGFPVYDGADKIGYSRDCSLDSYVEYWYRGTDGNYKPMPEDGSKPADVAQTTLTDGRTVDFIVRWERGTINRFIYSYAMLAPFGEDPNDPSLDLWNGRLAYHFQGGVGIGHYQGRVDYNKRAMRPEVLGQGYAIAYSTGTRTGDHYNLVVGGETALMVKEHFIKRFGKPLYTVGLGASGGAIQQYVYAQNHPGLIDTGVADRSYPDMVTQIIHVGDCELLEYYMDVTDKNNAKWSHVKNRSWLVGLNAEEGVPDPIYPVKQMIGQVHPSTATGSTECIESWRGLSALAMNPKFGEVREQEKMEPAGIMDTVHWTHFDDLRNVYDIDEDGYARVTFDNVGVQYGLQALLDGNITPAEFLDLNWKVGGWKPAKEMVQEGFPLTGSKSEHVAAVLADPTLFDPWSSRNIALSDDPGEPAPRTEGDLQAMQAAYTSGVVFDGQLDIPLIDWRFYLEEVLDMHNSHQSFASRQRILNKMGHADHQVIWFTDARPDEEFNHVPMALEVLDEWMMNLRNNPEATVAEARPIRAVDSCFATDGELIDSGKDVWNGILDDNAPGACTQYFPLYSTSRIVAGGPIEGGVFKCQLKSVETALNDGTYGSWNPTEADVVKLNAIFPRGVCDYSKPDAGRPQG